MNPGLNPGSLSHGQPGGRYTRPLFFDDSAFNAPLQPVVGVCWHEARAYCAWLSAQTDRTYRLPTEHEWEAAARGQARRPYAYDGQFDPAKGNTAETRLKRTTPIGVFPEGDTPDGISDLAGNSADWTSSPYRSSEFQTRSRRRRRGLETTHPWCGGWFAARAGQRFGVTRTTRRAAAALPTFATSASGFVWCVSPPSGDPPTPRC